MTSRTHSLVTEAFAYNLFAASLDELASSEEETATAQWRSLTAAARTHWRHSAIALLDQVKLAGVTCGGEPKKLDKFLTELVTVPAKCAYKLESEITNPHQNDGH